MTQFKIGGVNEHFNYPWHYGIEKGIFQEKDISIHWQDMHGGTGEMVEALRSGKLDGCVLLTEGITKAINEGLDASIVHVYVNSPLRWGIHVPVDSDIQNFDDLKGEPFAISRYGSGSHLMAFVKATQNDWSLEEDLRFKVVNNLEGGIRSLENQNCKAFLWEKYTTAPYVEAGRCRYIDEVKTPWPCFVLAFRNDVLEQNRDSVNDLIDQLCQSVQALENSGVMIPLIAERYGLDPIEVKKWSRETSWNQQHTSAEKALGKVEDYLEVFEKSE